MRRVNDVLLGQFGVPAGESGNHVRGLDSLDLVGEGKRRSDAERNRCEITALRGRRQCVEVLASELEDPAHGILRRPCRDLHPGLVGRRNLELRPGPGRLNDLKRIARRFLRVNDDSARCSQLGGLFVLVGPAPVVEPTHTLEEIIRPVRIVVDDHQDLAGNVHAFEVIPFVLGRLNSVADEDEFGVLDRRTLLLNAARSDVLVPPAKRDRLAALVEGPDVGRRRVHPDDVERLLPGVVAGGRHVPHFFELGDQETAGERIALAAGTATRIFVAGELGDRSP